MESVVLSGAVWERPGSSVLVALRSSQAVPCASPRCRPSHRRDNDRSDKAKWVENGGEWAVQRAGLS